MTTFNDEYVEDAGMRLTFKEGVVFFVMWLLSFVIFVSILSLFVSYLF